MYYLNNLKKARKKAGLTQFDIATLLEIPQPQISRYEKGKNEIPLRYFIEMCKLYKASADEILELK